MLYYCAVLSTAEILLDGARRMRDRRALSVPLLLMLMVLPEGALQLLVLRTVLPLPSVLLMTSGPTRLLTLAEFVSW